MVVREHYGVDRGQPVELHGCRDPAPRPEELNRGSSLAPDGVDEDVEPRDLDQKGRVSDPRHRQLVRRGTWHHKLRSNSVSYGGLGIRATWVSPTLDQCPLQEIHESV